MRPRKNSLSPLSAAAFPEWVLAGCVALLPVQWASARGQDDALPEHRQETVEWESLYLTVVINEVPHQSVHQVFRRGDALAMSAETLRELGLRVPPAAQGSRVELGGVPGMTSVYRADVQELRLTVVPALLDRLPLHLSTGPQPDGGAEPGRRVDGLLLNYDMFAQHGQRTTSVSGQAEARMLTRGGGTWTQSVLGRISRGDRGASHRSVRLDTAWRYDQPEDLSTLVVGDTITRGLAWTRPMRIAGLQLGRDLGLQPYRPTSPVLSLAGEAALPSTVELFINGIRQLSQPVLPGQFQIDTVPAVTGAGTAQIVVTDINGRARTVETDFYSAPFLLRSGLWDGALQAGVPRRDYGVRSAEYATSPVGIASYRYGATDDATVEMHAELGKRVRMLGAGVTQRLPSRLGVAGASLARSMAEGRSGVQQAWNYQFIADRASLTASLLRRTAGFRDAASQVDGPPARMLASLAVGASSAVGHVGLAIARQTLHDDQASSLVSAAFTRGLPGNSTLNVSVTRGISGRRSSSQLTVTWSMPLDGRDSLSANYAQSGRHGLATVDFAHEPRREDGGLGYRVQASSDGSHAGGHARLRSNGQSAQWIAGAMHTAGSAASLLYAGLEGSLLASDGRLRAMDRTGDAFALVTTSGVPDIPVKLENRLVGRTDAAGTLLVPRLNAYQRNKVSIDPLGLPPEYRVDRVDADAVPARGSGVAVGFTVRAVRSAELTLVGEHGRVLPPGTPVELTTGSGAAQRTVVGQDGLVYVDDFSKGIGRLRAQGDFGTCEADLASALGDGSARGRPRVVCRSTP